MAVSLHLGARSSCPGLRGDPLSSLGSLPRFEIKLQRGIVKRRGFLRVCCERGPSAVVEKKDEISRKGFEGRDAGFSVVMKFGGSSVASAERMREVANLILSFPQERPVVVLSAMGKTTNKLLQVIGMDDFNLTFRGIFHICTSIPKVPFFF